MMNDFLNNSFRVALVASFCIVFSACDGENAEDVNVEIIHQDSYMANGNFTEGSLKIISSREEYEEFLPAYSNDDPIDIDFSQNKLVLTDMGLRSSSGYGVELSPNAIEYDESGINLKVEYTLPNTSGNCSFLTVLTNPYAFILVSTNETVTVSVHEQEGDC